MKKQYATGEYTERKQTTLNVAEIEESLWRKGLSGDHCPRGFLNPLVYLNGLYFTLRRGDEHRCP